MIGGAAELAVGGRAGFGDPQAGSAGTVWSVGCLLALGLRLQVGGCRALVGQGAGCRFGAGLIGGREGGAGGNGQGWNGGDAKTRKNQGHHPLRFAERGAPAFVRALSSSAVCRAVGGIRSPFLRREPIARRRIAAAIRANRVPEVVQMQVVPIRIARVFRLSRAAFPRYSGGSFGGKL